MRRFLSRLTARDWAVVCGGLALVAGLEMAKPLAPAGTPAAEPASPAAAEPPAEAAAEATDAAAEGPAMPAPVLHPRETRRLVHDIARLTPEGRRQLDEVLAGASYMTAFAAGKGGATG